MACSPRPRGWSRCELRLDARSVELRTTGSRTGVPWPLVSRATVTRTSEFALTGPAPALVLWFKQGAPVPVKWRWRECFVPHSGGVAVVGIRVFDGVRGDTRELSTALTHFAEPERTSVAVLDSSPSER